MPFPAWPSLSYGTTDNQVYKYQVQDRDKLWNEQKAKVTAWLDSIEKCNTGAKARFKPNPKLQVRNINYKKQ